MNCGRFHIYFGCHFILLQFVKLEIYFIPTSDVCGVFGCEQVTNTIDALRSVLSNCSSFTSDFTSVFSGEYTLCLFRVGVVISAELMHSTESLQDRNVTTHRISLETYMRRMPTFTISNIFGLVIMVTGNPVEQDEGRTEERRPEGLSGRRKNDIC